MRARLHRPLLRFEIDVDDAEPLRVAEGPFEVVEEGPDAEAAQIDAAAYRLSRRKQVLAQIIDAQRIFDLASRGRRVVKSRAVLRDVNRQLALSLADPQQNVGESLRENFPIG